MKFTTNPLRLHLEGKITDQRKEELFDLAMAEEIEAIIFCKHKQHKNEFAKSITFDFDTQEELLYYCLIANQIHQDEEAQMQIMVFTLSYHEAKKKNEIDKFRFEVPGMDKMIEAIENNLNELLLIVAGGKNAQSISPN